MKACFKCGARLPLSEFYKHPQMADGHLNKCKSCTKRDVKQDRSMKRVQYSAYERSRSVRPERRKAMQAGQVRMRQRNPEKKKARSAVAHAIRDGRLERKPCRMCGAVKAQAHHHDYYKPLDIEWLCFKCHREHGHGQHVVAKD